MLNKCRKDGMITIHKPLPPHLLHRTSPRNVKEISQPSSSSSSSSSSEEEEKVKVECSYVTSVMQKSSRIFTRPGSEADMAHTLSPCSVKHLQDQFLSERREADAITQPLLDAEKGFTKDLESFLNHRDMLSLKKRELLHKCWTDCVWWPVQCSVKRRFARGRCQAPEMTHAGYENSSVKVGTSPLKDPLFLYSHSRLEEMRLILHCQTGRVDVNQLMEQSRNERYQHRGSRRPAPVYMTVDDGRCFRPECWSVSQLFSEVVTRHDTARASSTSTIYDLG